jgi:hypothetical protein
MENSVNLTVGQVQSTIKALVRSFLCDFLLLRKKGYVTASEYADFNRHYFRHSAQLDAIRLLLSHDIDSRLLCTRVSCRMSERYSEIQALYTRSLVG